MREKQPDAEAYITIRSFRAKNMYFIEIENSFDGTALFDKESGFPISTKEDKDVHGIGVALFFCALFAYWYAANISFTPKMLIIILLLPAIINSLWKTP